MRLKQRKVCDRGKHLRVYNLDTLGIKESWKLGRQGRLQSIGVYGKNPLKIFRVSMGGIIDVQKPSTEAMKVAVEEGHVVDCSTMITSKQEERAECPMSLINFF